MAHAESGHSWFQGACLITEEAPARVPQAEISREFTANFPGLLDELRLENAGLQRDVLLWQRWIRYAAALLASAGAVISLTRGDEQRAWVPLLVVGGFYLLFNGMIAWFLSHGTARALPPRLPAVMLAVDMSMVASLVYFSAPPAQFYRLLLFGFLLLQLAVFYFGTQLGLWAGALTVGAYVLGSMVVPPYFDGPRPTPTVVGFNTAIFLFVGGALVFAFGGFRNRMNKLRSFCKRVEIGDLTSVYEGDKGRRPDDLTLLAQSVDEMRHRLIELIGTDPLTGCYNRRAFETRLGREWRQARRRGAMVALLAIDLDKFKSINDTHGHPVGDMVLSELSDIMKHTARDTDVIARVGGDEFVILLPDTGWQGATTFAERLRRNVDEHRFGGKELELQLTISVGVAVARGTDDVPSEFLLEEADRSLYKAKSGGRNRISA